MIDFPGQEILTFFGTLAFGNIYRDAADTDNVTAFVDGRSRRPNAPAYLAIRPIDSKFRFIRSCTLCELGHRLAQCVGIVRMKQGLNVRRGHFKTMRVDPKDLILP